MSDFYDTWAFAGDDGPVFVTACGMIKPGPKVKELHAKACDARDMKWVRQVLDFVEVWHRMEWNEGREPEYTP